MTINKEPNFMALENNIIDIIKEGQIKLGYQRETLRLYYPMKSINYLLGTDYRLDELSKVLDRFCEFTSARLRKVIFSNVDARFCFVISPDGVTYVHEKVEDRHFLREFIQKISEHHCTLKDILEVFNHYSEKVVCNQMDNGEFDYLIYFEDGQPDSFLYCLKFEEEHAIYHRYTKADYEEFGF